jgi:hypothetical protein
MLGREHGRSTCRAHDRATCQSALQQARRTVGNTWQEGSPNHIQIKNGKQTEKNKFTNNPNQEVNANCQTKLSVTSAHSRPTQEFKTKQK